jgi:hypothetical protein
MSKGPSASATMSRLEGRLNLAGETATFELSVYPDKPDARPRIVSAPVGLDGRSRRELAAYAFVASKGSSLNSLTFVRDCRFLGGGAMIYWTPRLEVRGAISNSEPIDAQTSCAGLRRRWR